MPWSFRTLATMSLSTLVGMGILTYRATTAGRASAEEFQPMKEAEMPRGFPGYTPVGKIELKQYPAYRKATASGGSQFWTLFRHIKQNDIQMTAPVEMDFGNPRSEGSMKSMSFLYESPEQGTAGKTGIVDVNDVPAMTVVSIGCRGSQTAEAVAEAKKKLLAYLEEKKDQWIADGPMRVMGYNSPFVPRSRNFFEVQIPLKAVKPASEAGQKSKVK
jgi:hypothetical protein